jgi:hypothetical protein
MDKTAKVNKPKGKVYCEKKGTSCYYSEDDICVNCGRRKGWRKVKLVKTIEEFMRATGVETEHELVQLLIVGYSTKE